MNDPSPSPRINRRTMIAQSGVAIAVLAATGQARAQTQPKPAERTAGFKFSLNTATIRGQKLTLVEEIEIAAKAGYHAIEPWLEEIHRFIGGGGKAAELKKRISDLGLVVPSSIGFADWINDDEARRAAGLEQWKRDARAGGLDRRHPHGRAAPAGPPASPSIWSGWPSAIGSCST